MDLDTENYREIDLDIENYGEIALDIENYGEIDWTPKTMARLPLTSKTPEPKESQAGAMLSVTPVFQSLDLVKHENIKKTLL